jgi:hypothetical protein
MQERANISARIDMVHGNCPMLYLRGSSERSRKASGGNLASTKSEEYHEK